MDKQEYLNQISAQHQPAPKNNLFQKILHSKFLWIGLGCVAALIVIMLIGSALSSGKVSVKDRLSELILHINNVNATISEYQPNIKSSDLRSYSASLSSILSNTSSDLTTYATEKYNFKEKNIDKQIVADETNANTELNQELFEAKINGILDRIYAHKMAYEINLITVNEQQILSASSNEDLASILTSSYDSLMNLEPKFDQFSETK